MLRPMSVSVGSGVPAIARSCHRRRGIGPRCLLLATWAAVSLVACSSEESSPDLRVELSPESDALAGREEIRGTVTFAAAVPAGRRAHLAIKRGRPADTADADAKSSATASQPATQLTYTIRRVAAGDYALFAWVDVDGDGRLGPGDLAGYHGGATTAPVHTPAGAQIVTARNLVTADFGIGPLP